MNPAESAPPSRMKRLRAFAWRAKWKLLLAILILAPIAGIVAFALSPKQPSYITAQSEEGDLYQTVEAVGTVISERDLALQFPLSGIVSSVSVSEGDRVRAGQRIATLRSNSMAADIASAAARLASAEAELRARLEGSRPEDIAVSEADVASKRASLQTAQTTLQNAEDALVQSQLKLETVQRERDTALGGSVQSIGSTVTKEVTAAENALSGITDILAKNDVSDAMLKDNSSGRDDILSLMNSAQSALVRVTASPTPLSFTDAIALIAQGRDAIRQAATAIDTTFRVISSLPETSYFTDANRETYKASLAADRASVQASLTGLDSAEKTLRDAAASYETRIATEQSNVSSARNTIDRAKADISTYQAALQIAEAQLALKKAPARASDIAIAEANVRQMRAALQRAQADYSNTILTAPVAGTITKVHLKAGEITPVGAAVTMLGDSPYRVEMYVSEIDVPRIQRSQSGSIELDAFPGTDYALRVNDIDPSATDRDGVSKYRVRLDFVYPHDEFKIGMTGDARIVTGVRRQVVTVPLRSILQRDDGSSYVRILREDGSIDERDVEAGLEGEGGAVEVSNVEVGETIIVLEKS